MKLRCDLRKVHSSLTLKRIGTILNRSMLAVIERRAREFMSRFLRTFQIVTLGSLLVFSFVKAQTFTKADSTMVFGKLSPISMSQPQTQQLYSSWGVDLLISTNGFGLGTFYRREYTDDFAGYLDFSISEAKDDNEITLYDYYGNSYVPNKVNRFLLMPLFVGVQKRLFKDDIVDNFRPYINAAVGPTMIYVFPYNEEYFNALGSGHPQYTVGGYAGFGAFFGSERSNLFGLGLRYYYIPYPGGVQSMVNTTKTQFGGFYITFSFGSAW